MLHNTLYNVLVVVGTLLSLLTSTASGLGSTCSSPLTHGSAAPGDPFWMQNIAHQGVHFLSYISQLQDPNLHSRHCRFQWQSWWLQSFPECQGLVYDLLGTLKRALKAKYIGLRRQG